MTADPGSDPDPLDPAPVPVTFSGWGTLSVTGFDDTQAWFNVNLTGVQNVAIGINAQGLPPATIPLPSAMIFMLSGLGALFARKTLKA